MDQQSFDQAGYTIAPSILKVSECDKLLSHIKEAPIDKAGARNLLQLVGVNHSSYRSNKTATSPASCRLTPSQFNARSSLNLPRKTGSSPSIKT
jgi:hypothetical protein